MVAWGRVALVGCLCLAVLLSGCQVSVDTDDIDTDPLSNGSGDGSSGPYVIGIENNTERAVAGPLREVVDWWDEKEHEYDTAWNGEFVVRPNTEDPDLVVRVADTVDCDGPSQACAPKFDDGQALERGDGVVKIGMTEVPNRPALIKRLQHELGHVRGIGHCERPHWLMGCPGSAEYEDKDYKTRDFPWRAETNITVHLDSANSTTRAEVRGILDEYERSSETPANLSIRFVDDPWPAHVVLSVDQCEGCGYSWDIPQIRGGQGYGTDDDLEYIYWADVRVTAQTDRRKTAIREALKLLFNPD